MSTKQEALEAALEAYEAATVDWIESDDERK
jgi:hypothetical protein